MQTQHITEPEFEYAKFFLQLRCANANTVSHMYANVEKQKEKVQYVAVMDLTLIDVIQTIVEIYEYKT